MYKNTCLLLTKINKVLNMTLIVTHFYVPRCILQLLNVNMNYEFMMQTQCISINYNYYFFYSNFLSLSWLVGVYGKGRTLKHQDLHITSLPHHTYTYNPM